MPIFNYPEAFTTMPEYTVHAGQEVEIVRPLRQSEYPYEGDRMFEVRAVDGWLGLAFESELDPPPPMTPEDEATLAAYEADFDSQYDKG